MTYDGGLAEVRVHPIDQDKVEVRLGEKHFFDLVRKGKQWVAVYKATKRDAVLANLFDIAEIIKQYLTDEEMPVS